MKIAVVIAGEYRTFGNCRNSMHFINQKNVDVYFSTWNETSTDDQIDRMFAKKISKRPVSVKEIQYSLRVPATIKIHEHLPVPDDGWCSHILAKTWYLGFELVKSSGKHYDYVLLTRPDLFFTNGFIDSDIISQVDFSTHFGVTTLPSIDVPLGLDDHCFFTSYENMNKILSYESMQELSLTSLSSEWHLSWYLLVTKKFNLTITSCPFRSVHHGPHTVICRFNSITSGNISYKKIRNNSLSQIDRVEWISKIKSCNKLFIFELDKVMLDITNIQYHAINDILKGVVSINPDRTIIGDRQSTRKLEMPSSVKSMAFTDDNAIQKNIRQQMLFLIKQTVEEDSGLIAFFAHFKKIGGHIAVTSNWTRDVVKIALMQLGVMEHVDYYVSNDDVSSPKPHPEMYWKCMSALTISPDNTFVIEENPTYLAGAAQSGANSVYAKTRDEMPKRLMEVLIKENPLANKPKWKDSSLTVVIPMAGNSSRLIENGYPKPLVNINGKPMIQHVVENLNIDANYIFIVQKSHYHAYNLEYLLKTLVPGCNIFVVSALTDGTACTVLLAEELIDNKLPLLIVNSNQLVEWDTMSCMYEFDQNGIDGAIVTCNSPLSTHRHANINDEDIITSVSVNETLTDDAVCGIYYWAHGSDYVKYAHRMIDKNIRIENEFQIDLVYNEAIAENKRIKNKNVPSAIEFITPNDLKIYLNSNISNIGLGPWFI